ncbi:hypothetical protein BATDEDRAFT_27240 [Batrachochytrium dendrobatidis JAM81]|uniref:Uncharacterized protein n=1 Tax=Batrachochytrium dendrobatidis (strain JAM81 / FGSC 10211) TaxID=684364 RepID=F4PAB8_BATDJ|nr:uncharacterized protein BATDEDRAFT_27240 [Batrachochytrium dendrobatidis JAM81]EGF78038.1 hypothetical protein BATDEDRAFT_27240 [Batrachochytrium dendrobatidis JAM81]|eukprot:XP_006681416.1 hypothetical protein BATDEDRAFT_27240 [Batrachochytrium dendrobatidis JAM81]
MKLPTAVLSSILLVCSVTIAKPILPTETTSTGSVTVEILYANGVGQTDERIFASGHENLIHDYAKDTCNHHSKMQLYESLKNKATTQQKRMTKLERKHIQLTRKYQESNGALKHGSKLLLLKPSLGKQTVKSTNLEEQMLKIKVELETESAYLELKTSKITEFLTQTYPSALLINLKLIFGFRVITIQIGDGVHSLVAKQ